MTRRCSWPRPAEATQSERLRGRRSVAAVRSPGESICREVDVRKTALRMSLTPILSVSAGRSFGDTIGVCAQGSYTNCNIVDRGVAARFLCRGRLQREPSTWSRVGCHDQRKCDVFLRISGARGGNDLGEDEVSVR